MDVVKPGSELGPNAASALRVLSRSGRSTFKLGANPLVLCFRLTNQAAADLNANYLIISYNSFESVLEPFIPERSFYRPINLTKAFGCF